MDTISIRDLSVSYRVGVPDEERARPQRLLITVEFEHDFTEAARTDDLRGTIDYAAIVERLEHLGDGRSWKLIETLAVDIAGLVRSEFGVRSVSVEVKKFILPETRWVGVRVKR